MSNYYLKLGGDTDSVTTPDSPALSITGDIDIRFKVKLRTWPTDARLVAKTTASDGWAVDGQSLVSGRILFSWYQAGGSHFIDAATPSTTPGISAGVPLVFRIAFDADTGAGDHLTSFYRSDDGGATWILLGTDSNGGATDISDAGVPLKLYGDLIAAAYWLEIRDGIDGTIVVSPNFSAQAPGTTSFSDDQGNVWTCNGSAIIFDGDSIAPDAPSDLSAAVSSLYVNLSWTDHSDNETHFSVERSPNGSTGWTEIGTPTGTTYSDPVSGLTAETTYYYRVRAVNNAGASGYTSVVPATTLLLVSDRLLHLDGLGYASRDDADVTDLDYSQDFSVEILVWLDPNARYSEGAKWISKALVNSAAGWLIEMSSFAQRQEFTQEISFHVTDGSASASATVTTCDPGWNHAVLTFDATTKTVTGYINTRSATATNAAIVAANIRCDAPLSVGRTRTSFTVNHLPAEVAMARLWNRKLSSAEIGTFYVSWLSTRDPALPSGFDTTALLSEYLMDAESNADGDTNSGGYVHDRVGGNHLQLVGTAVLLLQGDSIALSPLSPANAAITIGASAYLKAIGGRASLTVPAGPLQYQFQVAEISDFTTVLKDSGWRSHFGQWRPTLRPSTTYYWRVRCRDSAGGTASSWTATRNFTTRAAVDWHVRPFTTIGTYGAEDGTSYENAWNGLQFVADEFDFSDPRGVVWGEEGYHSGDTLWAHGVHVPGDEATSPWPYRMFIPLDGYSDDYPVLIRGDDPDDPALLWNYKRPSTEPSWIGPDANNVYTWVIGALPAQGLFESISGRDGTWMRQASDFADPATRGGGIVNITTWTAPGAASHYNTSTNRRYVKMSDGGDPTGRVWDSGGWRFAVQHRSFITFKGIEQRGISSYTDVDGTYAEPASEFPRSTHIKWDSCVMSYGERFITPGPGNDYWALVNSTLQWGQSGVYGTGVDPPDGEFYPIDPGSGPRYMTVTDNTITDMSTKEFPDGAQDGHAIGTQWSDGWVVARNTLARTNICVFFYAGVNITNDVTIDANVINDCYGDGIIIGGGNALLTGVATGNRITNNQVTDVQGHGISSNCNDSVIVTGNTVTRPTGSCYVFSPVQGTPKHYLVNNTAIDPGDKFLYVTGADNNAQATWPMIVRCFHPDSPDPESFNGFQWGNFAGTKSQFESLTGFDLDNCSLVDHVSPILLGAA